MHSSEFFSHFKNLETECSDEDVLNAGSSEIPVYEFEELDCEISESEIYKAIAKFKT